MYAKYTGIFRTPKETSKIHQILADLRGVIREIFACEARYVIARSKATWQSPGRATLLYSP